MQKERKSKHFIKKPTYPGGNQALKAFVNQHLQYPEAALENKVEGTVFIRYTIDHEGKVTDAKIITSLGHGCDEEAQRVIRLLRFKVPKNRGVRAIFHKDIYVHFRLPQQQNKPSGIQYQLTSTQKTDVSDETDTQDGYQYTIEW